MNNTKNCGDNRNEVIAKAKEHILRATNIESSPEEMAVLDYILFRCWQLGWLIDFDTMHAKTNRMEKWLWDAYEKGRRDVVKESLKTNISEWHKVSDSLPVKDTEVLITTSSGYVFTAAFEGDSFDYEDGEYFTSLPIEQVKAWMELPKYYED